MSAVTQLDARPPLPVGATLDRGFGLLRRNLRPLLLPQLALYAAVLVPLVVLGLIAFLLIGDVATHTEMVRESTLFGDSTLVAQDVADFTDRQLAILVLFGTVGLVLYLWASLAASVSVIRAAERALTDGQRLPVGQAAREGMTTAPRLFGLGIVFSVLVLIALTVLVLAVILVAELAGGVAVLAGLAAFVGLVYLGVRFFLWPIVAVAEKRGLSSFGRAWELSRQRFWVLFALIALVTIVVSVCYMIASMLLSAVVGGLASIDEVVGIVAVVPYFVLSILFSLVMAAGMLAPLVVAHRVLAGVDAPPVPSDAPGSPAGGPPTDSGTAGAGNPPVARGGTSAWDAAESGVWADPKPRD